MCWKNDLIGKKFGLKLTQFKIRLTSLLLKTKRTFKKSKLAEQPITKEELLFSSFGVLINYLEEILLKEVYSSRQIKCYNKKELVNSYLRNKIRDAEINQDSSKKEAYSTIKKLYTWWTEFRPNRENPNLIKDQNIKKELIEYFEKEDNEMLIQLVTIRNLIK